MARGESQLTLFPQPKPTPEHRWPRGYDPERMHAVAATIGEPLVTHHYSGALPGGDVFVPQSIMKAPDTRRRQSGQAARAITDVVARSSIPMEDLRDMPLIKVTRIRGVAGEYTFPGQREPAYAIADEHLAEAQRRGLLRINPGTENFGRRQVEHAIIHELGHHADWLHHPAKLRAAAAAHKSYSSVLDLEGSAEAYTAKHNRTRRGGTPDYPYEEQAYANYYEDPAFMRGFRRVAGKRPNEVMLPPLSGLQFWHPVQRRLFPMSD